MPNWMKTTLAIAAPLLLAGCGLDSPGTRLPQVNITGALPSLSAAAKQAELQKMDELAARHAALAQEISTGTTATPAAQDRAAPPPATVEKAVLRTAQ